MDPRAPLIRGARGREGALTPIVASPFAIACTHLRRLDTRGSLSGLNDHRTRSFAGRERENRARSAGMRACPCEVANAFSPSPFRGGCSSNTVVWNLSGALAAIASVFDGGGNVAAPQADGWCAGDAADAEPAEGWCVCACAKAEGWKLVGAGPWAGGADGARGPG